MATEDERRSIIETYDFIRRHIEVWVNLIRRAAISDVDKATALEMVEEIKRRIDDIRDESDEDHDLGKCACAKTHEEMRELVTYVRESVVRARKGEKLAVS